MPRGTGPRSSPHAWASAQGFRVTAVRDRRQAHLNGKVAAALMEKAADLFADAPQIHQLDVIAEKL